MTEVAHNIRRFFDEGKAYLTQKTPFKDKHSFEKRFQTSLFFNVINILSFVTTL